MKALVIGSGLIGGSIGLALKNAGHAVEIRDLTESSTKQAQDSTQIHGQVGDPDLVVIAVPTNVTATVIIDAIRAYPNAIVIDVASVKSEVVSEVYSAVGPYGNFVPTHPMSGKEKTGASHAAFDLFQDRIWVISPSAFTDLQAIRTVSDVIIDCGGIVVTMSPEDHDKTVALTSHVPQVLASLLAQRLNLFDAESVRVSGNGLRDMTRLAASNAELWKSILQSNSAFIKPLLNEFADSLKNLSQALEINDESFISDFLIKGNQGRMKVPGKHGAPAIEYAIVSIVIDDKPGQLAGIFNTAGKSNINIEDVRIDHSLGKQQAVIELFVQSQYENQLRSALENDGWTVRANIAAD